MVEENVNEGTVEAPGSDATVKNEQSNETVQNVDAPPAAPAPVTEVPEQPAAEPAATTEPEVTTPAPAPVDPEEKIISDMVESGKTEVSTGELVSAGFDMQPMNKQYEFSVGKFKLTRLLLVSPYKIEVQE